MDRLIAIREPEQELHFTYDPLHRRISKRVESAQSYVENYIYDGNCEIGACDAEGNLLNFRVLGKGMGCERGAAVLLELQGRIYAPVHDPVGNIACLLDAETGDCVESYRLSAYGEIEKETAAVFNPWIFSCKREDPETGLDCGDYASNAWETFKEKDIRTQCRILSKGGLEFISIVSGVGAAVSGTKATLNATKIAGGAATTQKTTRAFTNMLNCNRSRLRGLQTPETFFMSKTYKESEEILTKKFGQPRGEGRYNKSFYNERAKRTYNLHQDPVHREGKPHIDIRKRDLPTDYYKDKPFFLKND